MIFFDINFSDWENLAKERDQWRRVVSNIIKTHDEAWLGVLARTRLRRHERGGVSGSRKTWPRKAQNRTKWKELEETLAKVGQTDRVVGVTDSFQSLE
ncbi:unnamed protein product [Arctia plantaginis]|uniref:Uncharacterized protein n=1 Tax=Arctia plantaginis TaxID=874455 RepID=A0A8S1BI04_ARCPL|nr:unnamed protein product [Arctia plantaginis]